MKDLTRDHEQLFPEIVMGNEAAQRDAAVRADREAWNQQMAAKRNQRAALLKVKRQARSTIEQATEVLLGGCQQFLDCSPDRQFARQVMQSYFAAKLIPVVGPIPPAPVGPNSELLVEEQ